MKPEMVLHSGSDVETPLDVKRNRIRLWIHREKRLFIDIEPTKDGGLLISGRDALVVRPCVSNVIEVRLYDRE